MTREQMDSTWTALEQSSFRVATVDDAQRLLDLERAANLVALAHAFPPEGYPYPFVEVLARWRAILADDNVVVLVLDDPAAARSLLALIAFDRYRVRHLTVRPDRWRHGLARRALELAVPRMTRPRLWVLEDNRRARGLYEHLGWRPTGRKQRAEFAPYPAETELALVRVSSPVGPPGSGRSAHRSS